MVDVENSNRRHQKDIYSFKRKKAGVYPFVLGIIIILFSPNEITAQFNEAQINKITDEQGNSPSATFSIVECSRGFIWFGTIDGLYRYDGYNFKIYRNDPDNPNSLANNTIRSMALSKDSLLWIATQGGGLDCFDMFSERFTHFTHTDTCDNEIRGNSLWSVLIDKKNNIWAGVSGKGVDRLDLKNMQFTYFNPLGTDNQLAQEQTIRVLYEDGNGIIWVGLSDNGFSSINPVTGELKHYSQDYETNTGLNNNWVYDIIMGSDNKLRIVTYGSGINIFNPEKETFQYIMKEKGTSNSLLSNLTYSIVERNPGEYWVATEYGISTYTTSNNQFRNFQQSECAAMTISENRARKIFIDKKGIIWVGTESGVDKFVIQSKFEIYQHNPNQINSLSRGIVRAIMEDDEYNLWIGLVDNGLVRYSNSNKEYKHYLHQENDPYSISSNNIDVVFQDMDGTIWVGDWYTGLMKYNTKRDNFILIADAHSGNNTLTDSRIQIIAQDKPGVLWIGTEQGINRFDIRKNEFTYYKHDPDDQNSLSGNSIQSRALVFDKDRNLWAGTWSYGLNKLEFSDSTQTTATIYRWQHDPNDPGSLPNNNVISLHFTNNGNLWIGTFGGGLSKFDPKTGQFKNYTTDDGLPNNIIFGILEDNKENLWLSTDYGISRFDPEDETFQNFTMSDGLQDNHFFWGAAHKGRSGKLYFGGINGVNSFIPENIKPDTNPARPALVDIKLFNESVITTKPLTSLNSIEFRHNENFISFEFTALDFTEPSKNRFKYMLEDFDKEWINSGNRHNAYYTNLSHGFYTFKLMASNSDGVWSDKILSFNMLIKPPWWKTLLARILFIFTGLSLVSLFAYLRFLQVNRQQQKLKDMVFERTNELHELNAVLEERQEKIETQNEELTLHRTKLEKLVEERTSDLENALKKAEESDRLKSSFLANMSHEIRTPMNAIIGFSQIIKEEDLDNAERNNYIDIIQNNCKSLLVIINDILDISLIEADQLVINKQPFDINKMFEELNNYYRLSSSQKVSIEFVCPEGCHELIINHDMVRIKQVLQNLIDNAIKFTEKGFVRFGYRVDNGFIDFFVEDTGIGIHQENFEKVLIPFTKVEKPEIQIFRGAGLGLAISKRIADLLKGKLTFTSKLGEGTTFHFLLPDS